MKKLESAVEEASGSWIQWDGVEAVGQGKTEKGEDCILVLISSDTSEQIQKLPKTFKGFKVQVQSTGKIIAQ